MQTSRQSLSKRNAQACSVQYKSICGIILTEKIPTHAQHIYIYIYIDFAGHHRLSTGVASWGLRASARDEPQLTS